MKKLVPAALALAAVLCAGLFFLRREAPYRVRAAEIAPPEALLFAHLPDIPRTVRRWPETALARIWMEPDVQAFVAQPLEKMPKLRWVREHAARLRRIAPREAFVAVVALEGATPKYVAGLNFAGSKSEVAALVAEPWAASRKAWPAGKSELLHRPQWEIETFTFQEKLLAGSFHAGWYFLANDLPALEATLGRCQGDMHTGIGRSAALQRAAAPLPTDVDVFVFAQPGLLLGQLGSLVAGGRVPTKEIGDSSPVAWGVKLEGERIRDTIFAAGARSPNVALRRATQSLTAPETLLYGAFLLPDRMELAPAASSLLALLPLRPLLADSGDGIPWADFIAGFGPEGGVVLDWPAAADAPSFSFVFQVRDAGRAAGLIESLTGRSARGTRWLRQEEADATHYQAPVDRRGGTAPALALTREFAVLGAQGHAVRAVANRLTTDSADITQSAPFHEIAARVKTPNAGFAYLDLRALFARSYETLRPFLAMSLGLSQELGPYLDPAELPSSAGIARHFGPSVYSQTSRHDGVLIESVGSLSLSQTLAALVAGAWSSAAPDLGRLGDKAAPPPRQKQSEAPAQRDVTASDSAEAAETSSKSGNADETSQIQASQR